MRFQSETSQSTACAFNLIPQQITACVFNSTPNDWTLRNLIASNPDSVEAIQDRLTHELDSIEAPPEYYDCILENLALAGYHTGFDNGKFEVEAKLLAIDAGVLILETVAFEIAMGPLGGAKLVASDPRISAGEGGRRGHLQANGSACWRCLPLRTFSPTLETSQTQRARFLRDLGFRIAPRPAAKQGDIQAGEALSHRDPRSPFTVRLHPQSQQNRQ